MPVIKTQITANGALVDVALHVGVDRATALLAEGAELPNVCRTRGLIDTGSTSRASIQILSKR